jgi:hypothetical protein
MRPFRQFGRLTDDVIPAILQFPDDSFVVNHFNHHLVAYCNRVGTTDILNPEFPLDTAINGTAIIQPDSVPFTGGF